MTKNLSALLSFAIVWGSVSPAFAVNIQLKPGTVLTNASVRAIPTLPHSAVAPTLTGVGAAANAAGVGIVVTAQPGAVVQPGLAPQVSAAPLGAAASDASLVGRLEQAVTRRVSGDQVFDAGQTRADAGFAAPMGLRPLPKPNLPQGIDLDEPPATPKPNKVGGVEINGFEIPGVKTAGGVFDAGPRPLKADPTSEADVERALRAMVDSDAARYGVASSELKTIHVRRVPGQGDQADTIYAYFRQQRASKNPDGTVEAVAIHGSYLSFTVKVVKNQPTVMAAMARLYPNITVASDAQFGNDELKDRATQKLPQIAGLELSFLERKIVYHKGRWKTVNLYDIRGLPTAAGVLVAIDVATGQVFAWDARHGVTARTGTVALSGPKTEGEAQGNAEAHEARPNGKPALTKQGLPHLQATIDGKKGVTDKDGKFSADISGAEAEFEASLTGTWVTVNDQNGKPVKIKAKVKPGAGNIVLADATADDLTTLNQLNMYIWITKIHDWWSERLGKDKRIDRQIPVNVNIDDECNAYYTPGSPSLNFFKESRNNGECSDTGRPGVGAHEYGHFVDDMIGGIVDGGLSEGWGDIGSMFLLGSPIIGDGFLRHRNPSYIRHGENTYQWGANDEVHDQGQAWMGFAWKLRKAMIAQLGEAAGAATAEALIVPTLFTKATDVPSQMAQVLLNAMDKNGVIKYEKEIRAAAKVHGIDLPANPRGIVDTLTANIGSWFGGLSVQQDTSSKFPEDFSPITMPQVTSRTLTVTGSKAAIEKLKADVERAMKYRPGDYSDVLVKIETTGGLFGAQAKIVVSGEDKARAHMAEQIRRLAGADAAPAPAAKTMPSRGLSIRSPLTSARTTRVIDSAEQYAELERALEEKLPAADFSKQQAVVVFPGPQSSGGYTVEMQDPVEENGQLVVRYALIAPSGMATTAISFPYGVKLIAKSDKPVRIERADGQQAPAMQPAAPLARNAYFVTVELKDGKTPEILSEAKEVLSVRKHSTGMWWWKKNFATYVVDAAPEKESALKAAGFSQLKELKVRLVWRRISDINGWGVEVNGENRRTSFQDLTFSPENMEQGFQLMRDFDKDPLAVLARYPEDLSHVGTDSVSGFERGYVIDSSIQMTTGNSWTKDERLLYSDWGRSGYYRGALAPAKPEAPTAAAAPHAALAASIAPLVFVGAVTRTLLNKGSKSEHWGFVLKASNGKEYVLYRPGTNPLEEDPVLKAFDGQQAAVRGRLDGNKLLVEIIEKPVERRIMGSAAALPAPREITGKELGVLNLGGIALSVGIGALTGHIVLGLLGTLVAGIPLIFAYVGVRRLMGDPIKPPRVSFAPRIGPFGR